MLKIYGIEPLELSTEYKEHKPTFHNTLLLSKCMAISKAMHFLNPQNPGANPGNPEPGFSKFLLMGKP